MSSHTSRNADSTGTDSPVTGSLVPASQSSPLDETGPARPPARTLWILAGVTIAIIFGAYEVIERYLLIDRLSMETIYILHIVRGISTGLIVAAVTIYHLARHPFDEPRQRALDAGSLMDADRKSRYYLEWFIQMRWIAIGVVVTLGVLAVVPFGVLESAALPYLGAWWLVLLASNIFFGWLITRPIGAEHQMNVQIVSDLVILSGLLNASGGLENPLYVTYLFHVIIAGIVLPRRRVVLVTALAATLFLGMALGEYSQILPHFTLELFPHGELSNVNGHSHGRVQSRSEDSEAAQTSFAPYGPNPGETFDGEKEEGTAGEEPVGAASVLAHTIQDGSNHEHAEDTEESGGASTQWPELSQAADMASPPVELGSPAANQKIDHASHSGIFVTSRSFSFVLVLFLISHFTMIVTDRLRRSEEDLEKTAKVAILERHKLERVIDAAGVGMTVVGREGELQWFNARASEWLGWNRRSIDQACPHDHSRPECAACLIDRTFRQAKTVEAEERIDEHPVRYYKHASSPVRDAEGEVAQVVHIVEDVTAHRQLEAEALHAGKLSVLGQMAAGIAHEIGNPLASLDTRLHLLKTKPADQPFLLESLDVLKSQIDRIGRIVRGVSYFARNRPSEWERWSLNGVVEDAVKLVRLDSRAKQVRFEQDLNPSLPPSSGVRDQILQVVINLLLNAIEAMPDGGTLTIETMEKNDLLGIAVGDTGIGIDDQMLENLFDPFFTTKKEGTGLGLSVCQSLVHAHGGTIEAESVIAEGSRFVMWLPNVRSSGVKDADKERP